MPAALTRFLRVAVKPKNFVYSSVIGGDFNFRPDPVFLMTSVADRFCFQMSSALHPFVADPVCLVACSRSSSSTIEQRRIRLLSKFSRNDWSQIGVFWESDCRILSLISWGFVLKISRAEQSGGIFVNYSVLPFLEADSGPDMFSFFSSKAKEVTERGVKEVDKKDDDVEGKRLKKEEEQRKRDEEVEILRKEKEIEDKIGPPPEKPLPGDCCGNGCTPCVWDTYWEELADYEKQRKSVEESEERNSD